jgi:Domain of unknown function (DUF4190)
MAPPPGPGASTAQRPLPGPVTAEGAKLTLILSILSFVFCGLPMGIPAVLVGRRTLRQIRQSKGLLKGEEITRAGIIMGYVSSSVWLVLLVGGYFLFQTGAKELNENEESAIRTIRQINDAESTYSHIYSGSTGRIYTSALTMLGPGPTGTCAGTGSREYACLMNGPLVMPDCREPHWCILKGYKFQLQSHYASARLADYAITATPVDGNAGSKNFCSTSDGVVRAVDFFFLSPTTGYDPETCRRLKPV